VLAPPTTLLVPSPTMSLAKRWYKALLTWLGWWRAPFWFLALFTGAKSFADNPILGSESLNRAGLHVSRLRIAHALTRCRRKRLAKRIPRELRERFDRDGFIVVENFLPNDDFAQLQQALLNTAFECRAQQQGDTITRRVAVGPELQRLVPTLAHLLRSARWRSLIAYGASTRNRPFHYIQTIVGGVVNGPEDPQVELHSDTFHPSLKAWLFLTDVEANERPLTYVAGSHRLSPERIAWEKRKSVDVLRGGDRLSQRGSFRIRPDELEGLGLPQATRFCVPANTLVIADTCGFHARASTDKPTVRVELWAYCRRNPFLPWTGSALISLSSLAARRVECVHKVVDWLDRRGLTKQHWQPAGRRRPIDV
jgi:RNase P protein component